MRMPSHGRWVGKPGRPASASPQRAPLWPVCRIPCRGSVLHARTRVHPSLARARCPIVCTRLSRRPSAAPPASQELCMRLLKQFSSRLQLSPEPFEAAPSEQPQLPVTSHPSCPCPTARAGGLPAASSAGQPLARLVRRGVVPVARGGAGRARGGTGGGMRVKSGFVFPILTRPVRHV